MSISKRKTVAASQIAASPMILSTDTMLDTCDMTAFPAMSSEMLPLKNDIDNLSSHLPTLDGDVSRTSPFDIHSSVLDSVFSSTLDKGETDQTPMFDELDFILEAGNVESKDDWVSLFGEGDAAPAAVYESLSKKRTFDDVSPSEVQAFRVDSTSESSTVLPELTQTELPTPASSVNSSPDIENASAVKSKKQKVDDLGCIAYSKKQRAQPLPPVNIDSGDPASVKRARNTEAARRSRARKLERMAQLEQRVTELLEEKAASDNEVARLQAILKAKGISF